ncbi:hypothetical protein B2K_07130 [Paenibacillus mucilaginosus K02]|uniref:Uncharacterized protein n=1 Tax=Paenibacillus mucilaginosus K02 TaxID=997761 RepID=I0BDP8_9BACL|nr:hypothetical protein B2K_07130 [Paenibacillus mucilaginosus K02]
MVRMQGTPLPIIPGWDIFSRYRKPRSHLRQRAHTSEVTTFIMNCVLSMEEAGVFFLALLFFALLTSFISHALDDASYDEARRLATARQGCGNIFAEGLGEGPRQRINIRLRV